MTTTEKLAYCKVCKNRKFSMEDGIVCGLTGEKPAFESHCEDYIDDEMARQEEKKKQEVLAAAPKIEGFLAFFVYWSIPISSIATVIVTLKEWGVLSALGPFAILFGIAYLAFYLYFQIYTIYGFVKRKPDAVFIAKFQLIVVAVGNLLTMLLGAADESSFFANTPRMVISILWCIVFFSFLCKSETVEDLIPKATRKLSGVNKFLIIMSIVIPSLLFVATILDSAKKTYETTFSSPEAQIKAACQVQQSQLPVEVSEGIYWTKMYVDGKTVVFYYCFSDEISSVYEESSEELLDLMGLYQKELGKTAFSMTNIGDDPLIGLCSKAGYSIQYVYATATEQELFQYTLSKEEYTTLLSSETYVTSNDDFTKILDAYNTFLPIEYFEGCMLKNCRLENSGNSLQYDLELTDMNLSTLSVLTGKYLKDHMLELLPYLEDIPFTLATAGSKELVYEFSADCSSWWKMTVRVSPDEYLERLK